MKMRQNNMQDPNPRQQFNSVYHSHLSHHDLFLFSFLFFSRLLHKTWLDSGKPNIFFCGNWKRITFTVSTPANKSSEMLPYTSSLLIWVFERRYVRYSPSTSCLLSKRCWMNSIFLSINFVAKISAEMEVNSPILQNKSKKQFIFHLKGKKINSLIFWKKISFKFLMKMNTTVCWKWSCSQLA